MFHLLFLRVNVQINKIAWKDEGNQHSAFAHQSDQLLHKHNSSVGGGGSKTVVIEGRERWWGGG